MLTLRQELLPFQIRCCAPRLHEATRPSTELSLVALVFPCRTFNQVPHSQDRPVGHADFRLQLSERRFAILAVGFAFVAEGMSRANPRTQWHPQTLKDSAHGDAELTAAGLALKETFAVALLLATDPEDL